MQILQAMHETALHLRQHLTHVLLLLVDLQELAFHRFMKLIEAFSTDRTAHRDHHIHAGLDQNALVDRHVEFTIHLGFIGENSWSESSRAIEPTRQQPNEALQRVRNDSLYVDCDEEYLIWQQDFEVNDRGLQ